MPIDKIGNFAYNEYISKTKGEIEMTTYHYHLTLKQKSNRKVTVATVETGNMCSAVAQDFFKDMGLVRELEFVSLDPTSEKIWKGYTENCQHFTIQQFNEWNIAYEVKSRERLNALRLERR